MLPVVAYVPVIHQGYLELFAQYPDYLYVLDENVLSLVPYLSRDVRACRPESIVAQARGLGFFREVRVVDRRFLKSLKKTGMHVVMPDEDISREVANRFSLEAQVQFVSVFLRYDSTVVAKASVPNPHHTITQERAHADFMKRARVESKFSPDWWRQIGAVAVCKNRTLLSAHNKHFPAQQTAYIVGDPRTPFAPGERTDISLAGHAERMLIGSAARRGISLLGADLYVTTFPCPACAIQIAATGFSRVFYEGGYSLAQGDEILREHGVTLVRVVP